MLFKLVIVILLIIIIQQHEFNLWNGIIKSIENIKSLQKEISVLFKSQTNDSLTPRE
jgi:hypothetical protein